MSVSANANNLADLITITDCVCKVKKYNLAEAPRLRREHEQHQLKKDSQHACGDKVFTPFSDSYDIVDQYPRTSC